VLAVVPDIGQAASTTRRAAPSSGCRPGRAVRSAAAAHQHGDWLCRNPGHRGAVAANDQAAEHARELAARRAELSRSFSVRFAGARAVSCRWAGTGPNATSGLWA